MEKMRNSIAALLLFASVSAYGDTFTFYGQSTEVTPYTNRSSFEAAVGGVYIEDFTAPRNPDGIPVPNSQLTYGCMPVAGCLSWGYTVIEDYGGVHGNAAFGSLGFDQYMGGNFTAFGVDLLSVAPFETISFAFHDMRVPIAQFTYTLINNSDVTRDMFFGLTADGDLYNVQIWNPNEPGSFWVDNATFGTAVTPEPGSLMLIGTGLVCLLGALRLRA